MSTNTGGFSSLLAPGLYEVLFNEIDEQVPQWPPVFSTFDSVRAYEEDLKVAGLGAMLPKPEGTNTSFDDPIQGTTVRYTHNSFGLGFRITREMWDDDLYDIMHGMAAELGRAAAYKIEVDAWSLLNRGFVSTLVPDQGFDGLALFSTAHTRLDGGATYANKPSVDVDFSYTAYQAALDNFNLLVDDRGRPLMLKPALCVVNPPFMWAAKEILQSEYKPYTENNEINPLKGTIDENGYLACRYLTDNDAWFVLSKPRRQGTKKSQGHDAKFMWRTRPETSDADDFLSGDALFKVFARYSTGHGEWRGAYGSSGG
jgi:phage major head subunit gpT-like protein